MAETCQHNAHNLSCALEYAKAGISVFACSADKKPLGKWRDISTTNQANIRWWWKTWPNAIVGIDLAKSGLVVVDADRHDPAKDGVAALGQLQIDNEPLPSHPIVRTRSNGEHHYFRNPLQLGNSRGALPDGIDVRGHGGYVIAGASVTSEGAWVADEDAPDLIESYKAGTILELPAWLVDIIRQPKAAPASAESRTEAFQESGARERAFAEAALDGCAGELAGITEGERNNRLNAIAFRLGRMVGAGWVSEFEVIRALEQACERNGLLHSDGAKQVRSTIRSGLSKGRLKPHEALAGELENVRHIEMRNGIKFDAETGEIVEERQKPIAETQDLERLTYCDGLIGDIVDWIVSTARRPNRVFALGAAITVIGTLIGRRVAGPTNSGTHLYVLGIGPTGAGKGTPINRAKDLLFAAGASHLIGPGEFTGGPAVSYHIESNPLSLCVQDEFGDFIRRVNNKNASSWETQVSKMFRELWSLSFERYDGMQWANRDRKVIHAPALSIFGLSTPAQFFDALKSGDLTNGFVNRFLVLPGKKGPRQRKPKVAVIPDRITEQLTALYPWRGAATFDVSESNRNHIPTPDVRPWASTAAESTFEDFEQHIDDRIEDNEHLGNFLERTAEMATRLATIRAAGRNIGNYDFAVDLSDIKWGISLAEQAGNLLVVNAGDMMGDPNVSLVERLIKKGGIKHSDLMKAVYKKGIKAKQLKDILETMDQANDIRTESEKAAKGRPALTYYWVGR